MISAVILTKNEEKNINACLANISWCDEVIVVDDYSTDNTVGIAKGLGAKVYERALEGNFAAQRNFSLEKAKHEWVLFIDADERVSKKLAQEIKETIGNTRLNLFSIQRKDSMWGRTLRFGESGSMHLVRLVRKDTGKWVGRVHEAWNGKGQEGRLYNSLLHYPHPSVAEFLKEINFYSTLRAKELYEKGVHAHWWSVTLYPKAKFFINYFLKFGFLDGIPGLIVAIMMSFHSFLVRGKLWLLWHKK